ncbi:hypothetical protein JHK82_050661 [Glycine max]|nr:hypothetical protein JHK82_050661 [Glycine max]
MGWPSTNFYDSTQPYLVGSLNVINAWFLFFICFWYKIVFGKGCFLFPRLGHATGLNEYWQLDSNLSLLFHLNQSCCNSILLDFILHNADYALFCTLCSYPYILLCL